MQITIDIPDHELAQLETLSKARHVSQDELVRSAVSAYAKAHWAEVVHEGFGLWADRSVDGLEYQEKMRSE